MAMILFYNQLYGMFFIPNRIIYNASGHHKFFMYSSLIDDIRCHIMTLHALLKRDIKKLLASIVT